MRWGLILAVCVVGVLVNLLSVIGILPAAWWLSLLISVVLAVVLGQFAKTKFFLHGFLAGLITAFINSLLIYLLYDTYAASNPEILEKAKAAPNVDMKAMMLYMSPLSAGIGGAVMGLLTMLAGKLFTPKKVETAPPPEKTETPTP